MAVILDALALRFVASSSFCPKRSAAAAADSFEFFVASSSFGPRRSAVAAAAADSFKSFVASSSFCPRRSAADSVESLGSSYAVLKCSLPPSASSCASARRRPVLAAQWKRPAKATGAEPNNYSSLEFLDPRTGEYKNAGLTAEEEEYGVEVEGQESENGEDDEELLGRFAAAIGLDDQDAVGSLFNKMRNPSADRIVRQLEEGVVSEDLLKEMYESNAELKKLFAKVERLIGEGDKRSAQDIVEGNYEALLEQLNEGVFGVEQIAMLDILASLYMRLEDADSAEQLLMQAKELLDLIPDTENSVENVLEHVATLFLKLRRPREALRLFTRSLSIREASAEDVAAIVRTMIGLASTYSELQQGDKSVELFKQILAYSEKTLGAEDEDLAAPLMHLGSSLMDEDRLDEAELTVERAMKLTEKRDGGKDGRYGVAICVLAQIKGSKGKFEEALECFRKGLQVMESSKDFSSAESSLNTIRMDIAALLTVMGREKEAAEALTKANIKDKEQYQYFSFQQVEYLEKLAEQYAADGELEQAERALRRSLQILTANIGRDSTQVSVVLQLLAALLHAQPDRQSEAEPLVRESIRIREMKFGKSHIAVGEAYSYLASVLHHQAQDSEAADLMYKVLHIQEKVLGFDHPELEETLDVLHMLLVNLGRHRETVHIMQRLEKMRSQSKSSFSS